MNYLKEYNITDEEIKNIEEVMNNAEVNIDIFSFHTSVCIYIYI